MWSISLTFLLNRYIPIHSMRLHFCAFKIYIFHSRPSTQCVHSPLLYHSNWHQISSSDSHFASDIMSHSISFRPQSSITQNTLKHKKYKKIKRMHPVLAPNHHPKRQLQKIQKHKKRNSGHYGNRQKDHSLNIITHSFNHWQNTVIFGYSSFDIPRRHRVWYPIHPIYGDTECTTRTEMKYKKRMHSEVSWKRNGNDRDSPIFIDIDSDSHNKSQQMQTLKI